MPLSQTDYTTSGIKIPKGYLQKVINSGEMLEEIRSNNGKKYLSVVGPITGDQSVLGAVGILLPLADVEKSMAQFQQTVMLFAISTALAFIVVGTFLLTRYLVKPLEKLIEATEDITEGYVPKH